MTLYTSDADDIYDGIRNGKINANEVRLISSSHPQSLKLLEDFPNVEEIFCPIICPINHLNTLNNRISLLHNLKSISFLIYTPEDEKLDDPTPTKRRRVSQLTPYEKSLKRTIPEMIRKLGSRMKYLILSMIIVDVGTNDCTTIFFTRGHLYIDSNNLVKMTKSSPLGHSEGVLVHHSTSNIFKSLYSTGSLRGLSTDGNMRYNLDNIDTIPELTIFAKVDTEENHVNKKYLVELVSKAEVVTILYDPKSIDERYLYSKILKSGTAGTLKQIKGIVPTIDVEDHIIYNNDLEEIHVLVRNNDDIDDMIYVMNKHFDRAISYYVHYCRGIGNEYWTRLKDLGDVVFQDVIRTLM